MGILIRKEQKFSFEEIDSFVTALSNKEFKFLQESVEKRDKLEKARAIKEQEEENSETRKHLEELFVTAPIEETGVKTRYKTL